ncbi:hypothetical protein [Floridanema evergladense]|uniref:Uncharacterized protein n=1 Tax=Floridaenema evergladense BLCC-F167 TaxID=3153639 RepID=A0ABV4WRN4_9CYAN
MSKKLCISILSLTALLGLTGGLYVVKETITPLIAKAYTMRVNLSLERQPNESYETIIRRAEAIARAAVQRSFDSDILVNEASVIVTCNNNGLIAPIISVRVSRSQWSNTPNIQRWTRYYSNSRALLDFDGVAVANAEQRRVEAAKPKVVVNNITIETDSDSEIARIRGSVTNQTGNTVSFVKVNYVVISGNNRKGDFTFVRSPSRLNPGQQGFFEDTMRDINPGASVEVNSIEWMNKDGSSGSWQPTR